MQTREESNCSVVAQFPEERSDVPQAGHLMSSLNHYFDLICHLVKRDFSLRFKRSTLGVLWSLVLPLAQLLVLVFLFNKIVPLNIDDYPAFVFSALLPWTWFSSCLSSAGSLFINNRDLVRRPNFEPSTIVIVNTLSNLLIYLVALPILLAVLALDGRSITSNLLFLPFLLFTQGVLIAGLSLIVATLNVFYRDVQQIMSVAIMLLFYMTPVFYSSHSVGENYRFIYILNPISILIESYRGIFFYGQHPDWELLLAANAISVAVFASSYFIYQRQLHRVIDEI
jgi:ABC-type polysaccharide/polyol phosphate export permease